MVTPVTEGAAWTCLSAREAHGSQGQRLAMTLSGVHWRQLSGWELKPMDQPCRAELTHPFSYLHRSWRVQGTRDRKSGWRQTALESTLGQHGMRGQASFLGKMTHQLPFYSQDDIPLEHSETRPGFQSHSHSMRKGSPKMHPGSMPALQSSFLAWPIATLK